MSRYIDADRLIYELNRRGIEYRADIDEAIRTTPTADVEQVIKRAFDEGYEKGKADRPPGEWIYIDEPIMGNPYGRYRCSECEMEKPHKTDYCPNCGAKMDME